VPREKKAREKKPKPPQLRFGIGEWYGLPFTAIAASERRRLAEIQYLPKSNRPAISCPFQDATECNKPGGVCSLRLYERSSQTGEVRPASAAQGELRTVCPSRFEQSKLIYRWVAETVLGINDPAILGEIGFLESPRSPEIEATPSDVGRIDKVLVEPDSKPLSWCALEVQAVYFQGRAMKNDFAIIRDHMEETVPFPGVLRCIAPD
jgi:hypothetical protein